jgi:hypothetical protein
VALLDRALHVTTKAGLFANRRRYRRDHNSEPFQRQEQDERKIITVPERCRHWEGHKAEQQSDRGMNRRREEERGDNAPRPLPARQRATAERRSTDGLRSPWGTSASGPPKIEREEYPLRDHSEWHAKLQEQQRPHVSSGERNEETGDNGPKRNGQPRPTTGRAIFRCHCKSPRNSNG